MFHCFDYPRKVSRNINRVPVSVLTDCWVVSRMHAIHEESLFLVSVCEIGFLYQDFVFVVWVLEQSTELFALLFAELERKEKKKKKERTIRLPALPTSQKIAPFTICRPVNLI